MSIENIVLGRTTLRMTDFIDKVKAEDTKYANETTDFFTPIEIALPAYAASFTGSFYRSKTAPAAVPTPTLIATAYKQYDIDLPVDCLNGGVQHLQLSYGSSPDTAVGDTLFELEEDETLWDSTSNPTAVYARHVGRVLRVKIPLTYSSAVTVQYALSYTRYPEIPLAASDHIDAPAEDINSLYSSWKSRIVRKG
jgi:hypothetical protein